MKSFLGVTESVAVFIAPSVADVGEEASVQTGAGLQIAGR